jgi:cation-transporting P-type ATPase A/B/Cu+-exporting ATPase
MPALSADEYRTVHAAPTAHVGLQLAIVRRDIPAVTRALADPLLRRRAVAAAIRPPVPDDALTGLLAVALLTDRERLDRWATHPDPDVRAAAEGRLLRQDADPGRRRRPRRVRLTRRATVNTMAPHATVDVEQDTGTELELSIGGMTCAACATRVQRKLNKLDGVTATVNFATEKASVRAVRPVEPAELITTVRNAGYTAELVEPDRPAPDDDDRHVKYLWRRLIVALLLAAPLGDLSITLALVPSLRFTGWQWVLLAMTIPVVCWAAWPFHRAALVNLRHRSASMDTLVSMGITAATCWSVYTIFFNSQAGAGGTGVWGLIFRPGGSVYLEVASVVTTFLLAGRLFEAKAKRRAGGALRALALIGAKDVAVLRADGQEHRIPVADLRVGDRFVVRPGETIATDGEVVSGTSAVDTSTMTGESVPDEVTEGDPVLGGTVAIAGRLVVRATRVGRDTQLAQLVALVERAQTEKAGVQRLADRVSAVFVPVVISLAALTLVAWLLLDGSLARAISAALAVLIIACPCALGLATPTALLVASGRGAQLGIFIKGHQALESARAIDTVVLDKTGTVTAGRMSVVDIATTGVVTRAELLRVAGAVEDASEHAVATAIVTLARRELAEVPAVTDFTGLAGLGARGLVDGRRVLVGSARLMATEQVSVPADVTARQLAWERQGRTTVLVAVDDTLTGVIALADTVKPSAAAAIGELTALGLRTVLLTGDNAATAHAVAAEVGIAEVIAEVLPDGKADVIARLRAEGRSVAMVGDGVNDAPALAVADLGMAVVTGTDVALGAADLILVRDDLRVVPSAVQLARGTLRTIHGNLLWAFGYNVAAVPLAAFGLLNPLIAGGAMVLSSLFVVSNSLRLRRFGTVAA